MHECPELAPGDLLIEDFSLHLFCLPTKYMYI